MKRISKFLELTIAGLVSLTCGGDAKPPTAPQSAPEGVTIFAYRLYVGESLTLDADVRDLSAVFGAPVYECVRRDGAPMVPSPGETAQWGDCISSIKVSPGWRGTAYVDDGYRGASLELTEDIPDLRNVKGPCREGFNDCISSIRVSRR